jgi:hypothetical protein
MVPVIFSNNNASHFGSMWSLGDHDQHTLAPSLLVASEAGSVLSSWRSVSQAWAMTHPEATGPRYGLETRHSVPLTLTHTKCSV